MVGSHASMTHVPSLYEYMVHVTAFNTKAKKSKTKAYSFTHRYIPSFTVISLTFRDDVIDGYVGHIGHKTQVGEDDEAGEQAGETVDHARRDAVPDE